MRQQDEQVVGAISGSSRRHEPRQDDANDTPHLGARRPPMPERDDLEPKAAGDHDVRCDARKHQEVLGKVLIGGDESGT